MNTTPVAITVGTGKVGSRVARHLRDARVPVRLGSRSGAPPFDWNDPATWAPFLDGATSVFVTYVPDIGFPGGAAALSAFGSSCRSEGIEHLVLLSGRGEEGAATAEDALRGTAGPITVLRCAWFDQNFSESFLLEPVLDGVIALPAGDVHEPFLDAEDIAEVAAVCLTDPTRHRGATYELTGPELLSFSDVAAELTRVIGRGVAYVPVEVGEYVEAAVAAGVPSDEAKAYAALFHSVTDGRNAFVTDDGRTARSGVWAR
jgi:uncharacterized protein YbjT (DUF2867 family)